MEDSSDFMPPVNSPFLWLKYCGMLFPIIFGTAFLLHCFLMPFMTPFFATVCYGTLFAENLHLFSMAVTFLVSGVIGFNITEKLQSKEGNGFLQSKKDVHTPLYDFNFRVKKAKPVQAYDHPLTLSKHLLCGFKRPRESLLYPASKKMNYRKSSSYKP